MSLVFSGIRPSGRLHLGNYFGAIKNWLEFQNKRECIFAIVDYHGITTPFKPEEISRNIFDLACDFLAVGLDPEKAALIVQSHIPEHLELAWIFGAITPVSWLERVPTFKEKISQHPDYVNLGLLAYPTLMAADILIYKAGFVPVGEDQLPHIELTNDIAKRFNHLFGETFSPVKAMLSHGARIMSLADPLKKMSKTGDEGIVLTDSSEEVRRKIKIAKSDSGKDIVFRQDKPAISNLLTIYSEVSGISIGDLEKKFKNKGYAEFKKELSEAIIKFLTPIQKRRKVFEAQPEKVKKIFDEGAKQARKTAQATLDEVKKKIGLGM